MTQNITYSGPKIALYQPDIPQNTAAIIYLFFLALCSCICCSAAFLLSCALLILCP